MKTTMTKAQRRQRDIDALTARLQDIAAGACGRWTSELWEDTTEEPDNYDRFTDAAITMFPKGDLTLGFDSFASMAEYLYDAGVR